VSAPPPLGARAWAPVVSDRAVVDRVLSEARVDAAVPEPGWPAYLQTVVESLFEWLRGADAPPLDLEGYAWVTWAAAWTIVAVAVAWIAVMIVRVVRARGRRARAVSGTVVESEAIALRGRDGRAWRAELERRLESGALGPALEALWWWFACAVLGRNDLERSWTSREVVVRAGRPDLLGLAREIDRMLYGPRRPEIDELRGLRSRLDQVLS